MCHFLCKRANFRQSELAVLSLLKIDQVPGVLSDTVDKLYETLQQSLSRHFQKHQQYLLMQSADVRYPYKNRVVKPVVCFGKNRLKTVYMNRNVSAADMSNHQHSSADTHLDCKE